NSDLDDVFWSTSTAGWYTDGGAAGVGIFRRDTAWAPYVPMASFGVTNLTLDPVSSCVHDGSRTVVVNVHLHNALDSVVGGQFFLQYDTSVLTLVSAAPGAAPFTTELYRATGTPGLPHY